MWKISILCCVIFNNVSSENPFINFGGFVCPREDRALGVCLRDTLNAYIPHLAIGVPQFGVPPSEPLHIPSISVKQSSGPISVSSVYTDVTVSGPSHMRVTEIEVDSQQHRVIAHLYIPELRMKGNYALSGQLLVLPIEGEGSSLRFILNKASVNVAGDIEAVVTIQLGRLPRDHRPDALTCEDLDVKFHIQDATMHLENLFGGEGDLGETVNQFLNDNWQQLSKELQPPMEAALRDVLKPLADHAFATLNADDVFTKTI